MIKRVDKISSLTLSILWRMLWVGIPLGIIGGIAIWCFLLLTLSTGTPTLMGFFYTPLTQISKYTSLTMPLPFFKLASYFSWIALTIILVRLTTKYPYRIWGEKEKARLIFNKSYGCEKFWWTWLWRLELFTTPLILSDFFYFSHVKPFWLMIAENIIMIVIAYFILRGILLKNSKEYAVTIKWIPYGSSIQRH